MAFRLSLNAFKEPRGMMRVLQFILAIFAFATAVNITVKVTTICGTPPKTNTNYIHYPFSYEFDVCRINDGPTPAGPIPIAVNIASSAEFFVATGVLSMLYCLFIGVVYAYADDLYHNKSELPLADFGLTTVLAVFWLSGSAAFANGTGALGEATDIDHLMALCRDVCSKITAGGYGRAYAAVLLGFLNFFLWAANLWFLYKETIWFKRQPNMSTTGGGGVTTSAGSSSVP